MTTLRLLALLALLAGLSLQSPAQSGDELEQFADSVLAPPGMAELDPDRAARELIMAIERAPTHPAAHTAVRMLQLLADEHELREPSKLGEFIERLGATELPGPLAARVDDLRALWSRGNDAQKPRYPAELDRFLFLGPFGDNGPGQIARAFRPEWDLREGVAYEGSHGAVQGRVLERGLHQQLMFPGTHVYPQAAVGYLCATLRAEKGAHGYLRIQFRGEIKVFWNQQAVWSTLDWGPERWGLTEIWLPVSYRSGDNQLMVKIANLGEGAIAVRACDVDARPAKLTIEPRVARLSSLAEEEIQQDPPRHLIRPSKRMLSAAALDPGPRVEMLIAWQLLFEGSQSEAIERARETCRDHPDQSLLWWHLARLYDLAVYLPNSYRSARAQEALGLVLKASPDFAPARLRRARWLNQQDQTEAALEIALEVAAQYPSAVAPALLEANLYASLGWTAEMEAALEHALVRAPLSKTAWIQRAGLAAIEGNPEGEIAALRQAVKAHPHNPDLRARLANRLARAGFSEEAVKERRHLVEWAAHRTTFRTALANLLSEIGQHEEAAAIFKELCEQYPGHPDFHRWRGWMLKLHGQEEQGEQALAHSLELEPGQRRLVDSFRERGRDLGRAFFNRYSEDALAHVRDFELQEADKNSSDILVVDIMIDRLHTDGSVESETQQVWYIVDRKGVGVHGEAKRIRGETIDIRTIRPDGTYQEPLPVNNAFAMPDLAPGNFLEYRFREFEGPARFDRPRLSSFFFGSEQKPFRLTRYVLALPKGYPVKIRTKTFVGDHKVEETEDEIIHVWERKNVPRLIPERFMPPRGELLPWVDWDKPLSYESVSRRLLHRVLLDSRPTREILDWAANVVGSRRGDAARAQALYDSVNRRVKERATEGTAVGALVEGTGNALALYIAGLRTLGIPWRYGVVRTVLPEFDIENSPEYPRLDRYSYPILQVRARGGDPTWVSLGEAPTPFGRFPEFLEGCEVFLATEGSGQIHYLPRLSEERTAQSILELEIAVQPDDSANLRGTLRVPASSGYVAKHLLRQAPKQMQERWASGRLTQTVPGLQVGKWEIAKLSDLDHPLELTFEGTIPRFITSRRGLSSSPLAIRPLQLGRAFGSEADRTHPLDLPGLQGGLGRAVEIVKIRVDPGDLREIIRPPRTQHMRFAGLTYSLDSYVDEGRLHLERRFALGPGRIPAREYKRFLTGLREIDDVEQGRIYYRP